jgi:serine protease
MLLATAILAGIAVSTSSAGAASFGASLRTRGVAGDAVWQSRFMYVSGEVVVKFGCNASAGQVVAVQGGLGAEELYVSPFTGARVWQVPASRTVAAWVDFLTAHPLVAYAEPHYRRSALRVPNDTLYAYQWHFDDDHTYNPNGTSSNPYGGVNGGGIRMEEAWTITGGHSRVVVAVVDTGVAYENYTIPSHEKGTVKSGVKTYQRAPDLAGTAFWQNSNEIPGNAVDDDGNGFVDDVHGWDFVNADGHPNDNNGHGTHVTGTIAQTTNNTLGVAGIAFNTTIMPIKVLDYAGGGTDVGVADGIYYAADNGAKIINLSLGGDAPSTTLETAVAYAYNHGVVVIAASGNDGAASVDYPAAYDAYVIAVGATRYDETRASYSNYGSSLDVVAPGGDVDVDQNEDEYGDGVLQQTFKPYESFVAKADPTDWGYWFFEGTSMATPHVAGVAALLAAQDATLTPAQIRYVLESTGEDLGAAGRDDAYGWGLIDAQAALTSAEGMGERFDFGPSDGPVEAGYIQVTASTLYSADLGFGWSNTLLDSRDRGAPDDLRSDFLFSNVNHTFSVDLADGEYQVTLIVGDQSYAHDDIDVCAENIQVVNDLTSATGLFQQVTFWVNVTDGQLNLRILDDGGADPNWVVNALTLQPGSPPPLPTEGAFDFGTADSPSAQGYTNASASTLYSATTGYGWTATVGMGSRDRGSPDNLRRDLVFASTNSTFNVDLQDGGYQVILAIGDQSYTHDLIDVYAEGILQVNNLSVAASMFIETTFSVTVSDGQLNLLFHDDGGADANWVINAIVVQPAPAPADVYFDFGTGTSSVEANYTAMSESTLYSAFVGYGWASTTGLSSRDRGSPDDLRRDLVFASANGSFNVDAANGEYQVSLVLGDQNYMHDLIDIYAEGVLKANNVYAAAGTFVEVTFTVTVSDGQLNLLFHDDGGVDANWVINALVMEPTL